MKMSFVPASKGLKIQNQKDNVPVACVPLHGQDQQISGFVCRFIKI